MSVIEAPEGLIFKNTRLPVSLHRQLAQAAKELCRSLNSEMIYRLRELLKTERPSAEARSAEPA